MQDQAIRAVSTDKLWLRLRQYIDGADTLEAVLAQLLDAAVELEELAQAGYILEQPVEADGLLLSQNGSATGSATVRARPAHTFASDSHGWRKSLVHAPL